MGVVHAGRSDQEIADDLGEIRGAGNTGGENRAGTILQAQVNRPLGQALQSKGYLVAGGKGHGVEVCAESGSRRRRGRGKVNVGAVGAGAEEGAHLDVIGPGRRDLVGIDRRVGARPVAGTIFQSNDCAAAVQQPGAGIQTGGRDGVDGHQVAGREVEGVVVQVPGGNVTTGLGKVLHRAPGSRGVVGGAGGIVGLGLAGECSARGGRRAGSLQPYTEIIVAGVGAISVGDDVIRPCHGHRLVDQRLIVRTAVVIPGHQRGATAAVVIEIDISVTQRAPRRGTA